jgi:hypothetical protein
LGAASAAVVKEILARAHKSGIPLPGCRREFWGLGGNQGRLVATAAATAAVAATATAAAFATAAAVAAATTTTTAAAAA